MPEILSGIGILFFTTAIALLAVAVGLDRTSGSIFNYITALILLGGVIIIFALIFQHKKDNEELEEKKRKEEESKKSFDLLIEEIRGLRSDIKGGERGNKRNDNKNDSL